MAVKKTTENAGIGKGKPGTGRPKDMQNKQTFPQLRKLLDRTQ